MDLNKWVFGTAVQPVFALDRGPNITYYQTGSQRLAWGPTKIEFNTSRL